MNFHPHWARRINSMEQAPYSLDAPECGEFHCVHIKARVTHSSSA